MRDFAIEERHRAGRYTLAVVGELDIATAPMLEAAMTRLCEAGALEIEIDLRDAAFIDSSGLKAILRGKAQCAEHRSEFVLVPGSRRTQRFFEVAGVLDSLPWRSPADPRKEP